MNHQFDYIFWREKDGFELEAGAALLLRSEFYIYLLVLTFRWGFGVLGFWGDRKSVV